MKRLKHICYYLGSTVVCLIFASVFLWQVAHALDGSLAFGKGGAILWSEEPFSFLTYFLLHVAGLIYAAVAAICWFYKAWWGTPADRLP